MASEKLKKRIEEANASSAIFGNAVSERDKEGDESDELEKVRRWRFGDVAISLDSRQMYVQDLEEEAETLSFGYCFKYARDHEKMSEAFRDLAKGDKQRVVNDRHYSGNTSAINRVDDYLNEEGVLEERFREGFQKVAEILGKGPNFAKEEIDEDAEGFKDRGYSRDEFEAIMSQRYGLGERTIGKYIDEMDAW